MNNFSTLVIKLSANMPRLICVWLFVLLASHSSVSLATMIIPLADEKPSIPLAGAMSYLKDPSHQLTIDEVALRPSNRRFKPSREDDFVRQGRPLTYWIEFKVENKSSFDRWILSLATSRLSEISLYRQDKYKNVLLYETGALVPFDTRPIDNQNFALPIELDSGKEAHYFLRVHMQSEGYIWLPMHLMTPEVYEHWSGQYRGIMTAFYAVFGSMLFYNLFLYLHLRIKPILFYCLTVLSNIFVLSSLDGFNYKFLWPSSPGWEEISLAYVYMASLAVHLVFVRNMLDLPRQLPKHNTAYIIAIGFIGLCLLSLFVSNDVVFSHVISQISGLITMVLLLWSLSTATAYKLPTAKYLFAGQLFFIAGTVIKLMMNMGLVPVNIFTYYSFHVGYLFEIILLSLAVADRFKILQEEKEELQKLSLHEAESSNHLKDQFLATISHELRTPITGVDASLQLIKEEELNPELKNLVNTASTATSEMIMLVDKVLDFAELNSGNTQINNINMNPIALIESMAERYEEICGIKKIDFQLDIGKDVPRKVSGDLGKLRAIMNILLDNAIKYTQAGSVRVSLNVDRQNNNGDATLIFAVRDTGIGIDEADQQRIFDYFRQVDPSFSRTFGGLGIGLSMCKALLDLLDGKIVFHSTKGRGSEFVVSIKFEEIPTDEEYVRHSYLVSAKTANKLRIPDASHALVVEDNPVNQMIIKAMLEQLGMTVDTANNGIEAIEISQKQHFDIILMDCQMPELDGFDTTIQIRQQAGLNQRTPILAVTANAMTKDIQQCLQSGMNDHVKKPIDKTLLTEKISQLIREAEESKPGIHAN